MLEESDIKRLTEAFVTKGEFNGRMNRLEESVEHIRATTDGLVTAFDKMAKNIEDLRFEYIAVKLQLDRHEKWIQQIAQKTGVVLSM